MYKIILVPLDGSKRAEAILTHIEDLSQRYDAKVIFLFVEEEINLFGYSDAVPTQDLLKERKLLRDETEAYLKKLKELLHNKGIRAETRIALGPIVKEIIKTAADENADLVAMASHGRGGLARTFYGSVAAGVLQRIDRPLLLIRSREMD